MTIAILDVLVIVALIIGMFVCRRRSSKRGYDGMFTVTKNEHGSKITLNIAPDDLMDKDEVKLKVVRETAEAPPPSVEPPSLESA